MKVELVTKTVGVGEYEKLTSDQIIAAVARHGTIKDDNGKLVKYLMNHKHWSPLQHITYGFKIETRRSISAQMFRHRSINGQEWSLRYAEPLGFEEIELRKEHPTNRQSSTEVFDPLVEDTFGLFEAVPVYASAMVDKVLDIIEDTYENLIKSGVAKECARDILPLCTKTTIHFTGTLRDILGFLNVRHTPEAQKEVRDIAYEMGIALEKEIPEIMAKINWREGYFM